MTDILVCSRCSDWSCPSDPLDLEDLAGTACRCGGRVSVRAVDSLLQYVLTLHADAHAANADGELPSEDAGSVLHLVHPDDVLELDADEVRPPPPPPEAFEEGGAP